MTIRLVLLYGLECWAFRKGHSRKMGVAEMRMLRWMSEHTLKDGIRSKNIIKGLRVLNIDEKMKENRLRYIGLVQR